MPKPHRDAVEQAVAGVDAAVEEARQDGETEAGAGRG